ncbi:hypothetical protein Tco_1563638 [Tanacetum coccineum]
MDEIREIIPKKKNVVMKDLMNSLSRRYKRIKQIPDDLGIQSALPAPIPEQALSKSSGRKRKHMELEPKTKVPRMFFIDVFGDQVFQRWNDIHKVGMDTLVSYLVSATMIKTLKNARLSLKLKKLIAEHRDQEKLKSKRVKLEALGYKLDRGTIVSTSKGDTGSPTGHSKKKKQSSSVKDSNPSQPPASTPVIARLQKGSKTSLTSLPVLKEFRHKIQFELAYGVVLTKRCRYLVRN